MNPQTEERKYPQATRLSRLLAQILDFLILYIPMSVAANLLGVTADMIQGIEEFFATEEIPAQLVTSSYQIILIHVVLYLLINSYFLWYQGQTLGKKIMKIAIVDSSQRVPSFTKLVALRYLPFKFFSAAPVPALSIVWILNFLFIFRQDQRCLHDLLAGTYVIDVSQAG